jgi:hypothetical protein
MVTLQDFKGELRQTPAPWAIPAAAAAAEIDRQLTKHDKAMEPLCSYAARLNPNYDPEQVFGAEELATLDAELIRTLETEPPVATKPNVDRLTRLFAFMTPAIGYHETLESRLREQLNRYTLDSRGLREIGAGREINVIAYWIKKRESWPELGHMPCTS